MSLLESNTPVTRDDIIVKGLSDLAIMVMGLKPNNKTKVPSLHVTQAEGMEILTHLSALMALMGVEMHLEQTTDEKGKPAVMYTLVKNHEVEEKDGE